MQKLFSSPQEEVYRVCRVSHIALINAINQARPGAGSWEGSVPRGGTEMAPSVFQCLRSPLRSASIGA